MFIGTARAVTGRGGLAVAVFTLILAVLFLTVSRAHSQDNRVGLVVQYGDSSVFTGCYPWTADLTGESLLRQAGLSVEADYGSGMGALICRIGPDGCPASDCLCQAQTPPLRYWAYWRLDRARGDWVYSQQGSSNRAVQPGDVDGWAWGVGTVALGAKPPKMTFEQVCPAPTATPSPTLTYTITPLPTATRAPTATMIPPPVAIYLPTATPPPTSTTAASPTAAPTATTVQAAVVVGEAPTATPLPTVTPIVSTSAALPTAAPVTLSAATEVALPAPTNPPQPAVPPAAAGIGAVGATPTATALQAPATSPAAHATIGAGGAPTVTLTPAPVQLGASGPTPRPVTATPLPSAPQTRPLVPTAPAVAVAVAPAGATVDLSRLTPVVSGASRSPIEGFNSGAPVGYIAFIGLVAGLGAVLWLRRRGDV